MDAFALNGQEEEKEEEERRQDAQCKRPIPDAVVCDWTSSSVVTPR